MFFPYTVSYLACVFAVATSPPVLRLAHGENGDAQISDPASEQLEASWDGPESELEMNAGAAAACSHYPNNPKLKRAIFFFPRRYWRSSKHRGTRWSSNKAKMGGRGREGSIS